jgi:hypothetical protein
MALCVASCRQWIGDLQEQGGCLSSILYRHSRFRSNPAIGSDGQTASGHSPLKNQFVAQRIDFTRHAKMDSGDSWHWTGER